MEPFLSWSIQAVNLAEHADNPVHTVQGGIAAGYDGAVVAGTTVYAYLTHPVVRAWGLDWVGGGGSEVRFRAPVLADEPVTIRSAGDDVLVAMVGDRECASCTVTRQAESPDPPVGDRLEPLVETLGSEWADYGARVGDDMGLYAEAGVVPPVVWTCLANRVFSTQLVRGPWVHTRSRIVHLGLARRDATAVVEAFLLERFTTRAGERAVVDVRITADGEPVAAIEHEAIVELAG